MSDNGKLTFGSRDELRSSLLTKDDIGIRFGVSRQSVHNWAATGRLPIPLRERPSIWLESDLDDFDPPRSVTGRLWTRDRIVRAIREFNRKYGRPPAATDWNVSKLKSLGDMERFARFYEDGCYPHLSVVYGSNGVFDSWAEAVECAGFPRPEPGRYEKPGKRRYRAASDVDESLEETAP